MTQIAIRCHHRAPVAAEEIEQWLEAEIERLRGEAPHAVLRLLRMSQERPSGELGIGWQIELEAGDQPPFDASGVARILRDLRLLGLEPIVLRPTAAGAARPSEVSSGDAA